MNRAGRTGRFVRALRVGRGFTLLEILVAVGAVAVLAVAIAAVFETTGRTVSGGRRVSAFNSYAAMIEQQLRRDISLITRDGHMMIRNEFADSTGDGVFSASGDLVRLHEGDLRGRTRRIDELMFFARGEFSSAREPLAPGLAASGSAARMYYGHGVKRRPNTARGPYLDPSLDQPNDESNTSLGLDRADNPNRYASDWTLLRHVAVLAPPRVTQTVWPAARPFGLSIPTLADKDVQVAGQPAVSSLFRVLATLFPDFADPTVPPVIRGDIRPQFSSGLVDVITDDLANIRGVVTTTDRNPGSIGSIGDFSGQPTGVFALETGSSGGSVPVLARMQEWMDETWPTWSHAEGYSDRQRMRFEPAPPFLLGVTDPATYPAALERAARRGDQLMLPASNFLPRCTEFIVEWSFGRTYPADPAAAGYVADRVGELIWHGLPRTVGTRLVADFYVGNPLSSPGAFSTPYRRVSGQGASHAARTDLIHGRGVAASGPAADSMTSYFGYMDPTFNPDTDADGRLESPNDSASPTVPWPWPRLIRVTLSLADPNDPTIEQTFQFVFDVPAAN